MLQESNQKKQDGVKKDISKSYNQFKEFQGKNYTGMKVGRTHKWYYDKGEWKEKKVTPDKWQFSYDVTKRRAGNAPEGSGVPVGTEYHWYILADQNVKKLDANNYTTSMIGLKYKLAHKRADRNNWSLSDNAQRKRLIEVLEALIENIKMEMVSTSKIELSAAAWLNLSGLRDSNLICQFDNLHFTNNLVMLKSHTFYNIPQ
jgi:hypothetical protein